jgi:hypothetical protein
MVIVLNVALQVRGGYEGFKLGDDVDEDVYRGLKILDEDTSDFQSIKLVEDPSNGAICLFLNDEIQNHSDGYTRSHHAMVDMSLKLRPGRGKGGKGAKGAKGGKDVKEVLILGGGDGYPAKHALTYPTANVTNVEIDGVLTEFIKKNTFTRKMTNNAFANRRLNLVIDDAYSYIYDDSKKYDLIVHDIEVMADQRNTEEQIYNHDYYIADVLLDDYGVMNYSKYLRGESLTDLADYYQSMKALKGGKLLLIFSEPLHFEFLNEDFLFDAVKFKKAHPQAEVAVFIQDFAGVTCGTHKYGSEIYVYVAKRPFSRENDELNYYVVELEDAVEEEEVGDEDGGDVGDEDGGEVE